MLYYTKCQKKGETVERQTHNYSDVISATLKEGMNPFLIPEWGMAMGVRQSFLEYVTSRES